MTKYPLSVYAVLGFLLLSVIIWIGFAVLVVAHAYPGLPDDPTVRWVMAGLAFGCGGVLFALTWALAKRIRIAYFLVSGLLVLLAVFSITDDIGWADLLYLAIVVVALVLLVKDRPWYLRKDLDPSPNG
jgi:chromate transport protein ChrA